MQVKISHCGKQNCTICPERSYNYPPPVSSPFSNYLERWNIEKVALYSLYSIWIVSCLIAALVII